jgi:HAD superfamily hydrolase (TIGR01509 family)
LTAAAIFDVDGTLVTFKFDVRGTREVLLREMSSDGFDTAGLGLATPTQVILDSARQQAARGLVDHSFEKLRQRFYDILDSFELATVDTTSVLPGVSDSLGYLKNHGVRLAVLTNSGKKAATLTLARAGISDLFEFVLTRDDIKSMKPSPDGLAKALLLLGLPPLEVCYVGDSPMDIMAGRAAGLKVISVATGIYSTDRLRSEGADLVVSSMTQLPGALGI